MGKIRIFDLGFVSSKIRISGRCWLWQGDWAQRYPRVSINGKTTKVAKAVWSIVNKKPWPNGANMLHDCDNTRCVSPYCVNPGTHAENMEQKSRRGKSRGGCPPGPNHPLAGRKLSNETRERMKKAWEIRRAANA